MWALPIGAFLLPFVMVAFCLVALPFDGERFHPSKIRRGHETTVYPGLRKVADKQAEDAEKRPSSSEGVFRSKEGTTRDQWCTEVALRLMAKWPGISYDEALRWVWCELGALRFMGVEFGDPDYGWSLADAREWADEIVSAYVEEHGSNA